MSAILVGTFRHILILTMAYSRRLSLRYDTLLYLCSCSDGAGSRSPFHDCSRAIVHTFDTYSLKPSHNGIELVAEAKKGVG